MLVLVKANFWITLSHRKLYLIISEAVSLALTELIGCSFVRQLIVLL